jgi:hypothetical protein
MKHRKLWINPAIGAACLLIGAPTFGADAAAGKTLFRQRCAICVNDTSVWGRPVATVQLADGSLLLSEDGNNVIYRISYAKPGP